MIPIMIRRKRLSGVALAAVLMCQTLGHGLGAASATKDMPLFNGKDTSGWRSPAGDWSAFESATVEPADSKAFRLTRGSGVLVNGVVGKTGNLLTELEHGDVEAHIEFMVPAGSNSGIYFQGRYEIQVLDSWGKETLAFGDCGGVYASCSGEPKCYSGKPPPVNASRKPGEWQSFDIVFRAPRFDGSGRKIQNARFVRVAHNGKVIHENVEVTCPTCASAFGDEAPHGPLMLQGDHGPVAYRNLTLKRLALD